MAVAATEPEGQQVPKASSDDIEKVNDAAVHTEHKDEPSYIPTDDSQYEVTFKTWIVVTVRVSVN